MSTESEHASATQRPAEEDQPAQPSPARSKMNKPLLIVLLVVLIALVVYLLVRPSVDTRPPEPENPPRDVPRFGADAEMDCDLTDEEGDFSLELEARKVGVQNRLRFTVTEANGWGAKGVYIRFWHLVKNEETGEWEQDERMEPVEVLTRDPLLFGQPLVYETPLTGVELDKIGGELGTSEEWAAEVIRAVELCTPK
jgi:hypothetical protein